MSFRPTMMALQRIKPATPYRSLRARVKAAEKQELQANTSPTPPKNPFGLQSGSTGSQSSRSRATKVMNVFDKTRLVSEDVREMSGIVEPNQVVKYRVIRTGSGHLPVYIEKSNNGRVQTIVRKIEGDSYSMRDHLNTYLQNMHVDPVTAPPQARVKPTNQHLILKGRVDEEIKSWLEQMGY